MSYKILCSFFVITSIIVCVQSDICEFCYCHNNNDKLELDIQCKKAEINLVGLIWPLTSYERITATFEDIPISILPKFSAQRRSKEVISITFNNNGMIMINRNSLKEFSNLQKLTVKNNNLFSLQKDSFDSLTQLEYVIIRNNTISQIETNPFESCKKVKSIDISHNKIEMLFPDAFKHNIESIDFSFNQIHTIECKYDEVSSIKQLWLTNNKMTVLLESSFKCLPNLTMLDLSNNKISHIQTKSLSSLQSLKTLNLHGNQILHFDVHLPKSLERLNLSWNNLTIFSFVDRMDNLKYLDVHKNSIFKLELPQNEDFSNLTFFNVSHNELETIETQFFRNLQIFDIGYNQFVTIPNDLIIQMPDIMSLILNGNPFEKLNLKIPKYLRNIEMVNLPHFETITNKTLQAYTALDINRPSSCLDISISHCPKLSLIEDSVFQDFQICKLDLSYNKLTYLPQNMLDWTDVRDGIDIQGNPFNCICKAQWMLDEILIYLYNNTEFQQYLLNLRCASPPSKANKRFVKYYKRIAAFCNPSSAMTESRIDRAGFFNDGDSTFLEIHRYPGVFIFIAMCIVVFTILTIVIIYTIRRRRKVREHQIRLLYSEY